MPAAEITIQEYQALITGMPKYCPNQVFSIGGKTYTVPEAITLFQSILDAMAESAKTKGAWKDAMVAEEQTLAVHGPVARQIRDQVGVAFNNATQTLAVLDIQPRKARRPMTTAERAAAAAKGEATRKARGTESKQKKATVHGNVSGVTITPIVPDTATSTPPSATTPETNGTTTAPNIGAVAPAGSTTTGTAHS